MARKPKERVVTDSSVKSGRQIREENKSKHVTNLLTNYYEITSKLAFLFLPY